jgi:hypothetical protein
MNDVPSEELLARVNAARVLAELPWASTNSVRASATDRMTAAAPLPGGAAAAALDASPAGYPSAGGLGAPSALREREEASGVSAHITDAMRAAEATRPTDAARAASRTRSKDNAPSPLRRRAPWLLAIGAGLVALLAVLGRPLTAGTREPVIVDVPAPVTRVRLNLQATPPSARFVLDGQALDSNPYQGERTMDAFPHTLEVSAEGHQRRSIQVHLNRDLDLEVRLAEEPPRRPIAAPPSSDEPASHTASKAGARSASTASPRSHPPAARDPRSALPERRVPEPVRAARTPAPSPAASRSGDEIYPDEPLPAPKPVPLEAY